ncbi:MAG: 50S ribosomal protein L18e [Candidatus Geothermarchaeota archaeon]
MGTNSRNKYLLETLNYLRKSANKYNAPIWRYVYELLSRPKRKRIAVNLYKINKYTRDNDVVVVPGKVLGAGNIDHRITIGAFAYSASALKKLQNSNCTVLSIIELIERYNEGTNVKIII